MIYLYHYQYYLSRNKDKVFQRQKWIIEKKAAFYVQIYYEGKVQLYMLYYECLFATIMYTQAQKNQ